MQKAPRNIATNPHVTLANGFLWLIASLEASSSGVNAFAMLKMVQRSNESASGHPGLQHTVADLHGSL